jgi:hypothetical protein
MLGIDTTTYPLSQVEYSWSERVWGAAVTYERWGIRIGAGPAFDPARWRGVQENTLNPNLRSEASGSLHPLGLLLDLGIHRGLISRLGIDVRAQARRFPATVLPGGYLGKRVSQNSAFVGIGLGTVF